MPESEMLSLMNFHRVLIASSILFCWGFGIYEIVRFTTNAETNSVMLGILFVILGCGMLYYLIHLNRFLGRSNQ